MSNIEEGNETEHLDVGVLVCYLPRAWSYKNAQFLYSSIWIYLFMLQFTQQIPRHTQNDFFFET